MRSFPVRKPYRSGDVVHVVGHVPGAACDVGHVARAPRVSRASAAERTQKCNGNVTVIYIYIYVQDEKASAS